MPTNFTSFNKLVASTCSMIKLCHSRKTCPYRRLLLLVARTHFTLAASVSPRSPSSDFPFFFALSSVGSQNSQNFIKNHLKITKIAGRAAVTTTMMTTRMLTMEIVMMMIMMTVMMLVGWMGKGLGLGCCRLSMLGCGVNLA